MTKKTHKSALLLTTAFAAFAFPALSVAALAPELSYSPPQKIVIYKHVSCTSQNDRKVSVKYRASFDLNAARKLGLNQHKLHPIMEAWFKANITERWKSDPDQPINLGVKSEELTDYLGFDVDIRKGRVIPHEHETCTI